ncbi:hypothetical protein TRFO_07511 [Tritrichomonas foetus]|uniref:RUN domain-containing protein n=1 Tax=Tritrichomonas foetus TaxID=1144522 RepID=A0A1J4JVP5_9EUKA|nr:hypothetical protein TRFO_07511 [Tritrichomonas foetus]|eukprot:OHT01606.1 hypothetical protein TRFO_07511 [Tritrichomonas foetus]
MSHDFPLLFSSLQNNKNWKGVEVSGSMILHSGEYRIEANGPFLFFASPSNGTFTLFSPNYTPMPDPTAKKPTMNLQCMAIPKIKHTLVFSDQAQVMDFLNYVFESNAATESFIMKADVRDYIMNDQITGVLPNSPQKVNTLMAGMQIQAQTMMFQAHIINKGNIEPGLNHVCSHSSFVTPLYEIPKILKKEKNIFVHSFAIFNKDKPNDISILILKDENEMMKWILSIYLLIVASQKAKTSSSSSSSANTAKNETRNDNQKVAKTETRNDNQKVAKTETKKEKKEKFVLDDRSSFIEIINKTILSNDVKPVQIEHFERPPKPIRCETFNISKFKTKPQNQELVIPDADFDFSELEEMRTSTFEEFLSTEMNHEDSFPNFEDIQSVCCNDFYHLTSLPSLSFASSFLDELTAEQSNEKLVENVSILLISVIRDKKQFSDVIKNINSNEMNLSKYLKTKLTEILENISNDELNETQSLKFVLSALENGILIEFLNLLLNNVEARNTFYEDYSLMQFGNVIYSAIEIISEKIKNWNDFNLQLINESNSFIHTFEPFSFMAINELGKCEKDTELIEKVLNYGIRYKNVTQSSGAWTTFCEVCDFFQNSDTIIENDEARHLVELVNTIKDAPLNDEIRHYETPLQDLVRIGLNEKKIHIWIMLILSCKEITEKYFNDQSTLCNLSIANYVASTIYLYIK